MGPEFGGSIGLILYIANVVNASMNCVGLAETIVPILKEYNLCILDGGINEIRLYSLGNNHLSNKFKNFLATCILLQSIIFIGTEFENKTQIILMITIIISIISHFVGTFLPLSEEQSNRGIVGYSGFLNLHIFKF